MTQPRGAGAIVAASRAPAALVFGMGGLGVAVSPRLGRSGSPESDIDEVITCLGDRRVDAEPAVAPGPAATARGDRAAWGWLAALTAIAAILIVGAVAYALVGLGLVAR